MDKRNGLRYAFRILFGITSLLLVGNGASAAIITVPTDYASIQEAIDNAITGDTIEVHSGTYYEKVKVTKQLTLRGFGMPVVDANGSGSAITLAADGIILEGFNARGGIMATSNNNTLTGNKARSAPGYGGGYGIYLSSSNNNTLSGNNASNNGYGIYLDLSSNNILIDNNASNNHHCGCTVDYNGLGIYLLNASNNTLIGNNANSNGNFGIFLRYSSNNTLIGNNANSNSWRYKMWYGGSGIHLYGSSNNTLIGNNASNNGEDGFPQGWYGFGISLFYSSNNIIYNNYFNNINNFEISDNNIWNIILTPGTNIIGGSYLGGNFWANPEGTGFSQTCSDVNSDGICDSTYLLNSDNIDYLPLKAKVRIKGDIDGDGEITATDALIYLKYSIGQNIPYQLSVNNDLTCDGIVNIADALAVIKKAVAKNFDLDSLCINLTNTTSQNVTI